MAARKALPKKENKTPAKGKKTRTGRKTSTTAPTRADDTLKVKINETGVNLEAKGFGQMLANFLSSVRKGIGNWYAPRARVREAQADSKIAKMRALTRIEVKRLELEYEELLAKQAALNSVPQTPPRTLEARAAARFISEETDKQENRERVAYATAQELNQAQPTADAHKPINSEWLNMFWSMAENVTSEELRAMFASLLAREIEKPGQISPLALRAVETLSPLVAERFAEFCRLSIRKGREVLVIHPHVFDFQDIGPLDEYGISFDDLFDFESHGLIRSAQALRLNYHKDNPAEEIDYAGIRGTARFADIQLHIIQFTRAGADLRNILVLKHMLNYTEVLQQKFGEKLQLSS